MNWYQKKHVPSRTTKEENKPALFNMLSSPVAQAIKTFMTRWSIVISSVVFLLIVPILLGSLVIGGLLWISGISPSLVIAAKGYPFFETWIIGAYLLIFFFVLYLLSTAMISKSYLGR